MKAHYLQHVPFEGPGYIETWLSERGIPLGRTRLFAGDAFPDLEAIELLIVMGGPMSVNDEADFPWLVEEKRFVQKAVGQGKAVLGICLGAQLIASALGARVSSGKEAEIGWFPVEPVEASDLFRETMTVFHWHGETFDLPKGAVHLARSEVCENQAFRIDDRVIGLQFHLETTPQTVTEMIEHGREELVSGDWIDGEEEMLSNVREHCERTNRMMAELLEWLVGSGGGD